MARPTILALDCATRVGWAVLAHDGADEGPDMLRDVPCGAETFASDSRGGKFWMFERWLFSKLDEFLVGAVYVEAPVLASKVVGIGARRVTVPLVGIVEKVCFERSRLCQDVAPASIKKEVAGRGRASKDEVVAAVQALGATTTDYDTADALALLVVAYRRWRHK